MSKSYLAIRDVQGLKIQNNIKEVVQDCLAVEAALQISINSYPYSVAMRSPGEDAALIQGLLYAEGLLKNPDQALNIEFRQKNSIIRIANIRADKSAIDSGYRNSRSLLSNASCGICGKREWDDDSEYKEALKDDFILQSNTIPILYEKLQAAQANFQRSGGAHAAAAFSASGELLYLMEDVGRHNAVDKVVGQLLLDKKIEQAKILLLSGRISYELVSKCYRAGIPVLAAVSAPSSLAVDYAQHLGITLLGFCRGERMTCYAHPQRLK